jgi:hypothetical protein
LEPQDNKLILLSPPPDDPEPDPSSTTVLTRETLVDYVEQQHVRNAKVMLSAMHRSLKRQLKQNSYKASELVAQMYGLVKSSPGVVINNLLQQNNYSSDDATLYFEGIIKRLEGQEHPSVVEAESTRVP